jgi:hypothetical protein
MTGQSNTQWKFQSTYGANDLIRIARSASKLAQSEALDHSNRVRDHNLISVVFAALSVEAFLNELPVLDWEREGVASIAALDERVRTVRGTLKLAEEGKMSSTLKLLVVHEVLGRPLDKGASLYQDFDLLKSLRDAIVHSKPSFFTVSIEPLVIRSSDHKWVRPLQSRNLLSDDDQTQGRRLFEMLSGDSVAPWAVKVASQTVTATLENLPEGEYSWAVAVFFREFLDGQLQHALCLVNT